ncbi:hypothetical protein LGKMAHEF_04059 [Aeromonas salmonicida]|nr:Uncharacterised protein [Aeromonas salmonicida]SUU73360.1 Uncharacterised protein [Aeromonas salmonicida]
MAPFDYPARRRQLHPVLGHRLVEQLGLLGQPMAGFGILLRHQTRLLGDITDVGHVAIHLVGHQALLLDGGCD